MAGATLTTAAGILKDFYMPVVREQVPDGLVLWERAQKNREDVSGNKAVLSVHKGRNAGIGSAAEDASLPAAKSQKYAKLEYTVKYLYGRMRITGPTIRMTKNNPGAFARAMEREMTGIVDDFKQELNRILNGDGTGTLTLANGAGSSTTALVVDSTRFLSEDMSITIGTAAAVEISTVDSETAVTLKQARTWSDNDAVKRENADEQDGIASAIDSAGTFATIARGTNLWWQAQELNNSGTLRDLTLPLFRQLRRRIETKGGKPPDFYFGKPAVYDAYGALLTDDKRYVNTLELDGGFKTLGFEDVPFLKDKDAADNTIFGINQKHLIVFEGGDMDFMDEDGAVMARVPDKDAYEATFFYYWQSGLDRSNNQGKLADLNEPAF